MKKILLFVAWVVSSSVNAQTYPAHPVRMVIPFPPGGSNDIVGRMIATQLPEKLGQPVVVENKGGAGGTLGSDIAAKAAPDGYTILLISVAYAFAPALHKSLPFDPHTAFAPIGIIGRGPAVLTVNPSVPANTVKELIALAKAKPGQLNYASAGVGSLQHLATALFVSQAGINVVHVPYKGGGPSMADVIAGHAQIVMPSMIQVLPHIRNGRLRALGVSGTVRSPALPDVPTIAEAGLPGYEAHNWWGLLAPAGTPQPILDRLNGALNAAVASEETRKRMETEGAEPLAMTPQQFGAFISSELVKWVKVAQDVGIKAE